MKKNFLQGRYKPKNPKKYKGDHNNIIYRSSFERKFLCYCDMNKNILEYSSEEIVIPYRSPIDMKIHRYFPDFYIKEKTADGTIKKYIIEIKPYKQTIEPEVKRRKTKSYIYEALEYTKNSAKWDAAREWCLDRGYEFKILTEKDLGIK